MVTDKIEPQEITKWLEKLEPMLDQIEVDGSKGEAMLQNMRAYVDDSRHFLENGKLVKSFEAMVWAWAIMELCQELEIFRIYGEKG